jgi:hypothetical protein
VGPTEALNTYDITMMSRNLAREYVHVVRFLGLHQRQIDQIESDYKRIKERIQYSLEEITTKKAITRQPPSWCDLQTEQEMENIKLMKYTIQLYSLICTYL